MRGHGPVCPSPDHDKASWALAASSQPPASGLFCRGLRLVLPSTHAPLSSPSARAQGSSVAIGSEQTRASEPCTVVRHGLGSHGVGFWPLADAGAGVPQSRMHGCVLESGLLSRWARPRASGARRASLELSACCAAAYVASMPCLRPAPPAPP
ncbi:hypothetical protein CDD83_9538 [Cordyceps sp. RAO-2017]|nr:hypothetical protein CDD83_9538 [Cordyceps sp. RAO-2017]